MYKNRNMRGGNSTSHSAEYYGGNSGSYYTNPPTAGGSAYGEIRPVSHGTIVGGETGPNLAVYPNGSSIQTGGQGCGMRRNSQSGGQGCGMRRNQSGGDDCTNGHASPKPNNQSGGVYGAYKTGGCIPCGCSGKQPKPTVKPKRPSRKGKGKKQSGGTHCSGSHSKSRSRTRSIPRSTSGRRTRSRSGNRGRARRGRQSKRHHTA